MVRQHHNDDGVLHENGGVHYEDGGVHGEYDIFPCGYDGHHARMLGVQGDEVEGFNAWLGYQHHELVHPHEHEDQHHDAIALAGRLCIYHDHQVERNED